MAIQRHASECFRHALRCRCTLRFPRAAIPGARAASRGPFHLPTLKALSLSAIRGLSGLLRWAVGRRSRPAGGDQITR
eukprot:7316283-Pyramimonas_sp.AAC.1